MTSPAPYYSLVQKLGDLCVCQMWKYGRSPALTQRHATPRRQRSAQFPTASARIRPGSSSYEIATHRIQTQSPARSMFRNYDRGSEEECVSREGRRRNKLLELP